MTMTDPSTQTNPPDPLTEALLAAASHGQRFGLAMTRTATKLRGQWATSVQVNRTRAGSETSSAEVYPPTDAVSLTAADTELGVEITTYLTAPAARELAGILTAYAAAVEAQS